MGPVEQSLEEAAAAAAGRGWSTMLVAVVQDAQQFVHLPVHGTKYRQHHPVITGRADKNRMHSAVGLLTDWEFHAGHYGPFHTHLMRAAGILCTNGALKNLHVL